VVVASMVAEANVAGVVVPIPKCEPVLFQKRAEASSTVVPAEG